MREWENIKAKRFVFFADILGFKELVHSQSHEAIVDKLEQIVDAMDFISGERSHNILKKDIPDIKENQSRAVSFSDSIIVFTEGDTYLDACKILSDAHAIMHNALDAKIPIKGSISFGDVTADFEKSLFFGKPIIDSYLLHDELNLMSVIIDHSAERILEENKEKIENYSRLVVDYDVPMKYGKVKHKLLRPSPYTIEKRIEGLADFYYSVSGKPRIYYDNTIAFWNSLVNK